MPRHIHQLKSYYLKTFIYFKSFNNVREKPSLPRFHHENMVTHKCVRKLLERKKCLGIQYTRYIEIQERVCM